MLDKLSPEVKLIGGGILAFWLFGPQLIRMLTREAVGTVVKTAEGAVIGIGEGVGIPQTDVDKCQALVNEGKWWDASFYCPAGTFLKEASGAVIDVTKGEVIGTAEPSNNPAVIQFPEIPSYDIWSEQSP